MAHRILAACGCHRGKVRRNNEDNFWFHGNCLPAENRGADSVLTLELPGSKGLFFAVFDGMGGEAYGEVAAWSAAMGVGKYPEKKLFQKADAYLEELTQQLNLEVFAAAKAMGVDRMGATLVGLYLDKNCAWGVNLGDSRGFCLRDGELTQFSKDHTDGSLGRRKPGLTQYLGIDPMELMLEPHFAELPLQAGDRFLLCSDGVTDMVSEARIASLMEGETPKACVESLLQEALEQGGRDNITAIVIFVM